jgi:hypothetical protein
VHADNPIDVFYAGYPHIHIEGTSTNICTAGTYSEVVGTIQRYDAGSWTGVASCYDDRNGPGQTQCNADYPCPTFLPTRYWRNQALGYVILNGVGYSATNTSATEGYSCS